MLPLHRNQLMIPLGLLQNRHLWLIRRLAPLDRAVCTWMHACIWEARVYQGKRR